MREQDIAYKYARAIFDVAGSLKIDKVIIKQLEGFISSFKKEEKLYLFFKHPGISKKDKLEIIETIAQSEHSKPLLVDFLKLLILNNRIKLLNLIYDNLKQLEYESSGIQIVIVESPVELDKKDKEIIKEKFSKIFERKVELKININPSLLGGLKVSYDNSVFDASFKNQLENLRRIF